MKTEYQEDDLIACYRTGRRAGYLYYWPATYRASKHKKTGVLIWKLFTTYYTDRVTTIKGAERVTQELATRLGIPVGHVKHNQPCNLESIITQSIGEQNNG